MMFAGRGCRVAVLLGAMLFALSLPACATAGQGRIPSYRYLEQNASSNSDFQPPNSLPK